MRIVKYGLPVVLVLLFLVLVSLVSCPERDEHADVIMDVVDRVIAEELSAEDIDAGTAVLGSMVGSGLAKILIDNVLYVDEKAMWSVGALKFKGKTTVVSFGLLNRVELVKPDRLEEKIWNLLFDSKGKFFKNE